MPVSLTPSLLGALTYAIEFKDNFSRLTLTRRHRSLPSLQIINIWTLNPENFVSVYELYGGFNAAQIRNPRMARLLPN